MTMAGVCYQLCSILKLQNIDPTRARVAGITGVVIFTCGTETTGLFETKTIARQPPHRWCAPDNPN
jgi:hypothetical protein